MLLKKISVKKSESNPDDYVNMLTYIGVKWHISKINYKPPQLKNPVLSKVQQEKEDYIKSKLRNTIDNWVYCKFQVHFNKLKRFSSKICNWNKIPFEHYCSSSI